MPGAAAVIAAQQAVLAQEAALKAPVVPQVPGLAAHAAAEAQVKSFWNMPCLISNFKLLPGRQV